MVIFCLFSWITNNLMLGTWECGTCMHYLSNERIFYNCTDIPYVSKMTNSGRLCLHLMGWKASREGFMLHANLIFEISTARNAGGESRSVCWQQWVIRALSPNHKHGGEFSHPDDSLCCLNFFFFFFFGPHQHILSWFISQVVLIVSHASAHMD